jgi:chromosome segregation ATPase
VAHLQVDRKLIAEYQNKVESLQDKLMSLEASLEDKEQEIARIKQDESVRFTLGIW